MFNTFLLIGLGAPEIILIVVAILLLFGGKKIPELMRGLGKGVKEFKDAKDGDADSARENENKTY
ncbi:sec-independent protein translocase protein TatA [Arcticibacter pallidicorallinus]|uniref:Sec-independent protein translocase protein TatA n=1 Tax=Arcticibacter pallidicorallinus TaxID=1259464 RepID=A0A2T0U6U7_9SPHI|nr:twin-arginine translocase TatA/TatE family subunit [Arcticibacter pallidicorallinus]PRY53639.1 sec-independent protein translocase protein TatA [Arcticibacter pallidicorallinus]